MTSTDLKTARHKTNWTQQQAASKLGLTQAYLSMLERGQRPVTSSLAAKALKVFDLPPTALPLESEDASFLKEDELKSDLGTLGYPGFSYLRGKPRAIPRRCFFMRLTSRTSTHVSWKLFHGSPIRIRIWIGTGWSQMQSSATVKTGLDLL